MANSFFGDLVKNVNPGVLVTNAAVAAITPSVDLSKTYGTLLTNFAGKGYSIPAVIAYGIPCPDPDANAMLNANCVGVNVDPSGYVEDTTISLVCNTVKSISIWMKGTVRAGDSITTAYPIRMYLGIGGYSKFASFIFLIPADGEWHNLIFYTDQSNGTGGFNWNSTDVIDRIRVRPSNPSENGAIGFNTATSIESNYIGPVRINPTCRPKFFLRFDDSLSVLVHPESNINFTLTDGTVAPAAGWSCLSLLGHYGHRASVFHLPRRIGTSNALATFATWEDLKRLKEAGWDNCFQSYFDPADLQNSGIRLLGPYGFADRSVASVDISANTITSSVAHSIFVKNQSYGGYPIVFTGTALPSPLVTGVVYWALATSSTSFKLYTNENDAVADTNAIDLTTTGTPASFKFHYAFAANDYSQYANDVNLGIKMLTDHGYTEAAKYWALNQGATDGEVMKLAASLNLNVFGVYKGSTAGVFYAAYPQCEFNGTTPAINWKAQMKIAGAMQTDASVGIIKNADVEEYVDKVIDQQCWGMNYHHKINNASGPLLDYLCWYLKQKQDAGLIDVITCSESAI